MVTTPRLSGPHARPTIAKMVVLTVRDGCRDEVLGLLEATRRAAATEPGTLQWELHEVDGSPSCLALYESFADEAAVTAHDGSAAVAALVAGFDRCLAESPEARLLRVL